MKTAADDSSFLSGWSLPKGSAQTFYARTAGALRVQRGRIWVTVTASSYSPQARRGLQPAPADLFIEPGNDLALCAGQTVVIESWPANADSATVLEWKATLRSPGEVRWQNRLAEPSRELSLGLLQVARAVVRLVVGMVSYADVFVAGRGKVQCALESNAP